MRGDDRPVSCPGPDRLCRGPTATVPGQITHAFPLGSQPLCCGGARKASPRSGPARGRSSTASASGSPASRRPGPPKVSRPAGAAGLPGAAWIVIGTVGLLLLVAAVTMLRDRRPRRGVPGGSKLVLERAAEDSFNLAVRLHHDGRRREAASAYERAEQSGDADAAFNLGVLYYEAGDHDAAEAAWRRCIERGHPKAATDLGFLLQSRGDRAGARDLYRNAARWGMRLRRGCSRSFRSRSPTRRPCLRSPGLTTRAHLSRRPARPVDPAFNRDPAKRASACRGPGLLVPGS